MKSIKIIIEDLKSGKNIDLYSALIGLLSSFILGFFKDVSPEVINSFILLVLCLVVISSLRNRHFFTTHFNNQSNANIFFSTKHSAEFETLLKESNNTFISGVSLTRTTITYYTLLEQKIQRGDKIRVLLVDPDSDGCKMALMRHRANDDLANLQSTIHGSLNRLKNLQSINSDCLEIRLIDNPLTYGAYGFNLESASGKIFVENYPFKTANGSLPKFQIDAENKGWFDFYRSELELLWEHGTVYN